VLECKAPASVRLKRFSDRRLASYRRKEHDSHCLSVFVLRITQGFPRGKEGMSFTHQHEGVSDIEMLALLMTAK